MIDLLLVPLTDPQWVDLFKELELSGSVQSKEFLSQRTIVYKLQNLGIEFFTDVNGLVSTVQFLVGPEYLSELPFGMKPGLRANDLHEMFGPPIKQLELGEVFTFDRFRVTVFYSFKDETLEIIRLIPIGEE